VYRERFARADERGMTAAFLPDRDPLIRQMDLHDDELPAQFPRKFDVPIENFDGVFLIAIFTDDAQEEQERLSQVREIGDALQRGGRYAGLRSPKERSPAVVGITSGVELDELRIDLRDGREVVRLPELPIEHGIGSFHGAGVPRTPRSIEDDHHAVVTPPPDVPSHHPFLINGPTEAGAVVLLDDIRKRQSQIEEHDGKNPKCLGGRGGLDAKEELLLLRMDAANAQEVDGSLRSLDVAGTNEVELHHLLSNRFEEADRVEHIFRSSFLFLAMRLAATVRLERALDEVERDRITDGLVDRMRSKKNPSSALSRVLRTFCSCARVYLRFCPFTHPR